MKSYDNSLQVQAVRVEGSGLEHSILSKIAQLDILGDQNALQAWISGMGERIERFTETLTLGQSRYNEK